MKSDTMQTEDKREQSDILRATHLLSSQYAPINNTSMTHQGSSRHVTKESNDLPKELPLLFLSRCMESLIRRMIDKKTVRDAYVRAEITSSLAHQIRALRVKRGWSQRDLADKLKTKQSFISKIENPSYGKISLNTLFDLSCAFDVGLDVKFVSLVSMVRDTFIAKYHLREIKTFEEEHKLISYYESLSNNGILDKSQPSMTFQIKISDTVSNIDKVFTGPSETTFSF